MTMFALSEIGQGVTVPAGSLLICPDCDRPLYRLTRTVVTPYYIQAADFDRVLAVNDAENGVPVVCPEHGSVRPYLDIDDDEQTA